jgi:hypothetical protein
MFFDFFKKFFNQINASIAMAKLEQVKLSVPSDAAYVTLVQMAVSQSRITLSKLTYDHMMPHDSVVGKDISPVVDAYMFHDGSTLYFTAGGKQILSTPITNIETLQSLQSFKRSWYFGRLRGGFVCNLRDGRSIIISTPMPVEKDQSLFFRTIGRSTDLTGGWAKELEPFGIETVY